MKTALKGKAEHTLTQPQGITSARIDPKSGLLAATAQKNGIFEIFRNEFAPKKYAEIKPEMTTQQTLSEGMIEDDDDTIQAEELF